MINKDFNSILDLVNTFPNEEVCILHLEKLRWNGHIVSPFDAYSKVYKCANHKYRCKETKKYFNVKTSTLFDNTKIKLQKWFIAIWLVTSHKKGISSLQLSKDINVTQKTAWFMLQRIRACFNIKNNNDDMLDSTVKIDETYVCSKNRHANKRISHSHNHVIIKHNENEYIRGRIHTNTIEVIWSLLKKRIIHIYHCSSKKYLQKYVNKFVFTYTTEANHFNLLLVNLKNKTTYKGLING